MTVLLIVIPIFVVLAALALFASMRRRDTEAATGELSRETRKRDHSESPSLVGAPASGREVEKSAALERRPPGLCALERPQWRRHGERLGIETDPTAAGRGQARKIGNQAV